jgi:hypothetical protein
MTGPGITQVTITAPNDNVALLQFCWTLTPPRTLFQIGIALANIRKSFGNPAVRVHDNAVSCPAGLALAIAAEGALSVSDNSLESLGFVSQPESPFPLMIFIVNSGQAIELATAALGFGGLGFGTVSGTPSVFDSPLLDGRTLFHGNQVNFSSDVPLAAGSLATQILSLDDTAIVDNQFRTFTPGTTLGSDVIVTSYTVRAGQNRFAEIPFGAVFSLSATANWAIATDNQATNCISVTGTNSKVETNNQITFPGFCERAALQIKGL